MIDVLQSKATHAVGKRQPLQMTRWGWAFAALMGGFAILAAPNPRSVAVRPPVEVKVLDPSAAKQQLSGFLKYRTVCSLLAANHVSAEGQEAFTQANEVRLIEE